MRIAFATLVLVALLATSVATADRSEATLRLKQRVRAPVNPTSAQSMSSVPSSASVAAPIPPVGSNSMAAPNPSSMSASSASMAAPPVAASSASMAAPPAAASASMSVMSSSNSADAVSDSQTHENQVTVNAAPLSSPSSSSASSSSSSCSDSQACKPTITCTTCGNDGNGNQDSAVEDAVGPITQWLKDFKKRSGSDSDLFSAAKTVVQPLISKIKRNQDKAIEKLQQSNAAILQHIEEAATEHVYNLLRANRVTDENHESSLSASASSESSYWSSESSHSSSHSGSSGSLSALSSAAADKVYSELLKAASHSESSESRSELQKIAQDIVKNAKSL